MEHERNLEPTNVRYGDQLLAIGRQRARALHAVAGFVVSLGLALQPLGI
jgi:hypothetical protein